MNLDPEQEKAVETTKGPLIITAGPGSGKTRVLVERILFLIQEGVPPEKILALTFTNKAADEMRKRLEERTPSLPYISTFHSLAYDVISLHGALVEVPDARKNFEDGLLNFDSLLSLLKELFEKHDEVLRHYQERFCFISVDEYQDTNPVQGDILRLLGAGHGNVCVIGDPNQAIYGFRGATLENFFSFDAYFPNPMKISLSKNYRSHPSIHAAARLIFGDRISNGDPISCAGEYVSITSLPSDKDEVSYILREVKRLIGGQDMRETDAGLLGSYHAGDIAILYRLKAIGKEFARAFSHAGIPCQLVGEENFFEKPEIRELLKYLQARDSSQNPPDAIRDIIREKGLQAKYDDSTPLGAQKYENILQLQTMAALYNSIESFLRYALLSRAEDVPLRNDAVTLMTAHASKGLEFPVVFVAGVEEGLFPYERSEDTEEERRLLYVAMTRAKERLYITHARRRMLFGKISERAPSPFLDAIPENIVPRQTLLPKKKKGAAQARLL
ncbi:MAG: ATP-dependent helicase [Nanoarchaeota archaeon]|nr:ATP-dependent helicase [Nanoarchaeota archaeon]